MGKHMPIRVIAVAMFGLAFLFSRGVPTFAQDPCAALGLTPDDRAVLLSVPTWSEYPLRSGHKLPVN